MPKLYTKKVAYGLTPPLINIINDPVKSTVDPTANDRYEIGQLWINMNLNTVFMLTSFFAGAAIWTELDNGGGASIVWTVEAGAAIAAANNHGYILTNAGAVTVTLPAVSPVGSQIHIIGRGGAPWTVRAQAGDTIRLGVNTSPAGGRATSAHNYATAVFYSTLANTAFDITDTNDNILIAA